MRGRSAVRWLALLLLAGCGAADGGPRQACLAVERGGRAGDASAMVWVPGGVTVIGSDRFHAEEAPKRRVHVEGFWIDRHEVTNADFAAFIEATGYRTSNERNGGGAVFRASRTITSLDDITQWWRFEPTATWRWPHGASGPEAQPSMPVLQVTFADALAYARWKGRDLPTEVEWERAARGGIADAEFGWVSDSQPSSSKANVWQGAFPVHDAGVDGYRGLAPVGCFPANGYGLHDMAGNVWEITSTNWSSGSSKRSPVIKGGSWLCADSFCLRYRPAARQPSDPDMGTDHVGFRTIKRDPKHPRSWPMTGEKIDGRSVAPRLARSAALFSAPPGEQGS